jgi:hypothetical protein
MKKLLLTTIGTAALLAAAPAQARLQISISANGATFSCFDGELGCDQSGGANNLLLVNTSVGGAFVEIALTQAVFGNPNTLELSASSIVNTTGAPITIGLVAGDTDFVAPTRSILESGSLTFNNAIGSGPSSLSFFADRTNVQGANPLNTPGALLDTVTGTPTTNPDSFAGSLLSPFVALTPFSMTESASLALIAGGSITGFNQSEQSLSAIPEPRTWIMMLLGFAGLAYAARRGTLRQRDQRAPA